MLAAVGSGIPWLLFPLAMAAVLFAGYFFGVSGGILSAVSCSLVLLLCNGEFLAVFLLLAGGVTAGFFAEAEPDFDIAVLLRGCSRDGTS